MQRTRYFDKAGEEVSASRALSAAGVLRDGFSLRVPAFFKDAARFTDARAFWDRNKDTLICTDVRRIGGSEGNKPGFRVLDDNFGRAAKDAALRQHEQYLRDAWRHDAAVEEEDDRKECPDCEGNGFDQNGKACPKCGGTGEVPDDDDADQEAEAQSDAKRGLEVTSKSKPRRRRRPEPDEDDDDSRPPYGSQDARMRTVDEMQVRRERILKPIYDSWVTEVANAWRGNK